MTRNGSCDEMLSEEWGEDPKIVTINSVVVEDGVVLAAAAYSDKRPTRIRR